jgi:hypothetical protein
VRQAAGWEVPERLEGVDPDVLQDKCQGLTPKKKVRQKKSFSLSLYLIAFLFVLFSSGSKFIHSVFH